MGQIAPWLLAAADSDGSGLLLGCGAIVLVIVVIAAIAGMGPGQCGLCGNSIKRKYYTWTIDGKRHNVCPNCNRRLESRQSKAALDRLGL